MRSHPDADQFELNIIAEKDVSSKVDSLEVTNSNTSSSLLETPVEQNTTDVNDEPAKMKSKKKKKKKIRRLLEFQEKLVRSLSSWLERRDYL